MTLRVVLDINTLVSAVVFPRRSQGHLVALGLIGQLDLVLSEDMMRTLAVVLDRPYFMLHTTPDRRNRYMAALRRAADVVLPDPSVRGIADDEEDDLVLGTAVAAHADYLVTGDHGLLEVGSYRGVTIITARDFLSVLEAD